MGGGVGRYHCFENYKELLKKKCFLAHHFQSSSVVPVVLSVPVNKIIVIWKKKTAALT